MKADKSYYKAGNVLIKHHAHLDIYRVHTATNPYDITKEQFEALSPTRIKDQEFNALLNTFFRSFKDSWIFEHTHYRKLDNFEVVNGKCVNYNLDELPKHTDILGREPYLLLVYYQGKVYNYLWSYGGMGKGVLFDVKTKKMVAWTKPKNCAPILNTQTKRII